MGSTRGMVAKSSELEGKKDVKTAYFDTFWFKS